MEVVKILGALVLISVVLVIISVFPLTQPLGKVKNKTEKHSTNFSAVEIVDFGLEMGFVGPMMIKTLSAEEHYYRYTAKIKNMKIEYPLEERTSIRITGLLKGKELKDLTTIQVDGKGIYEVPKIETTIISKKKPHTEIIEEDKVKFEDAITLSFWKNSPCVRNNLPNNKQLILAGLCKKDWRGSHSIKPNIYTSKDKIKTIAGEIVFNGPGEQEVDTNKYTKLNYEVKNTGTFPWYFGGYPPSLPPEDGITILLACEKTIYERILGTPIKLARGESVEPTDKWSLVDYEDTMDCKVGESKDTVRIYLLAHCETSGYIEKIESGKTPCENTPTFEELEQNTEEHGCYNPDEACILDSCNPYKHGGTCE